MSKAQILWDNWSNYDDLQDVYRQGFLKIKAYGFGAEAIYELDRYNVDSTLTHSGRSAMLFSDMMDLWPSYFKNVDKYIALKVMQNHDIGELVVGDVVDDGRAEHEDKKDPEWDAVATHFSHFPEETYIKCKYVYRDFENSSTFLGQSMKMADKLDFLAKLIKLESQGMVLNNNKHYSENDWKLAKEIGTDNFIDIIGNHLRHLMLDHCYSDKLIQIAIGFMTSGLSTIDRPFFKWWKKPMGY